MYRFSRARLRVRRRRPRAGLALCVLVLAAAAGMPAGAVGAESAVSLAPADLRDALHAAWQRHPSYHSVEAKLAAAGARLDAAGQPLYNPSLELDGVDEGDERTTTAGLNLALDLSGKRRVRRDAAAARVDQATAEAKVRRRDFVKQWFVSWADLQTAEQRVRTGQRRLALLTRFAGLAEKQFEADDISGLERDLAQLARDEARAEQAQRIAERAEAESRFRAVGGSPDLVAGFALPTETLPQPVVPAAGVEQLPDLQVAQAAALSAQREVTVARRNRVTDPTLGVRGGRVDYGNTQGNVFGVTLTVPLFLRNSYRAEVVAAQADADAAIADVERVQLELTSDRRRAVESYEAARSAWSGWKSSRGTDVEHRANLLERLWREGELSTTDYLLQVKQTLDTQLAGAELEARLWRSYADYLASTGQLERWAGMEGTP